MTTRSCIRTRFVPPTTKRDPRIRVTDDGPHGQKKWSLTITWVEGLGIAENHKRAAQTWLNKFNPGHVVQTPGLSFDGDFYWSWEEE